MARLIDADALIISLRQKSVIPFSKMLLKDEHRWFIEFENIIKLQPTTTEAEIRNKAIDEFTSALVNKDNLVGTRLEFVFEVSDSYDVSCRYLREYIYEIAEKLKGGE